jgi:diacylglycerol kinase family enzyme
MSIVIYLNPRSGNGQGAKFAAQLDRFDPILTDPPRIEAQVSESCNPGDHVVIAGGDGTVSLAINVLFRTGLAEKVTVSVYPLGTGNDLGRALKLAKNIPPAIFVENLSGSEKREISLPVWSYGEIYFVNYLTLGIDAKILALVDSMRQRLPQSTLITKFLYVIAGLSCLNYRIGEKARVTFESGEVDLQGKAGMILSNIDSYAGGSPIGSGNIEDEYLDLTVLESSCDLLKIVLSRFSRGLKDTDSIKVKSAQIHGSVVPIEIDGETEVFQPASVSLVGRVRILV